MLARLSALLANLVHMMLRIWHRSFWLPALVVILAVAGTPSAAQNVTFDIKNVGHQKAKNFKRDFYLRKKVLEQYFAATSFVTLFSGPLHVNVFQYMPPASEALLPAWEGHRGDMKFAALRAKDGTASILHELTHVHAPNQVRYLAEGYAVYLEEMIGNIDAYPTFGRSIESQMRAISTSALGYVNWTAFDGVTTKRGHLLGDNVGLETAINDAADRASYAYLVSGSFAKFLIDGYGLAKFKTFYELTPLTPGLEPVADPARYNTVFGKSPAELQTLWLNWFGSR
jgi:hypothetical protein